MVAVEALDLLSNQMDWSFASMQLNLCKALKRFRAFGYFDTLSLRFHDE